MLVEPIEGWRLFVSSRDVIELISRDMGLVEKDEVWQYYDFSEKSSTWCSNEVGAINQVHITFEDENKLKIKKLDVELTNNKTQYFKKLFKLKKQLKIQFNIRVV